MLDIELKVEIGFEKNFYDCFRKVTCALIHEIPDQVRDYGFFDRHFIGLS